MPILFIVCGTPGAGKTTYGRKLAEERGAVFLDIDTATEKLVRQAIILGGNDPQDRDSIWFKDNFREVIYEQLFDIARDNLFFQDVVLAGPFTKEIKDSKWPEKLSEHVGAAAEVYYMGCRPEVRKERLLKRNNLRDKSKLENWDTYIQYYEGEPLPACKHVFIDNSGK